MGLILYAQETKEPGKRLLKIIKKAIPDYNLQIYSSIEEFTERLHQSLMDVSVAVLHAATRSELMDIIFLGDLLGEIGVVLVLPDSQPEFLKKHKFCGHALLPRPKMILSIWRLF